jgi:hypothetical protein
MTGPKLTEESGREKTVLAAAFCFFLLFAALSVGKPPSSDEHWFVLAAHDCLKSGVPSAGALIHPPLYTLINCRLLGFFGDPRALKLTGILLGLGSAVLLFLLGMASGFGKKRSALAALLLCCSPVFIQGSLLLDTDNTLVVFSLLAMLFAFSKNSWVVFSAALSLCLWSKLAASVPVVAVLSAHGAWLAFKGDKRGPRLLAALAAGVAVFFVTFYVFCRYYGLPFASPFEYLWGAFLQKRTGGGLALPQQFLQLLLWVGGPFCCLWLAGAVRAFRGGIEGPEFTPAALSVIMAVGYLLVGGLPFGFPRYHMPAVALGCWLASGPAADGLALIKRPLASALAVAAGAVAVAAAGDPIYMLRFTMRAALAAGSSVRSQAELLAILTLLPIVLMCLFWILLRRNRVPRAASFFASAALACLGQFAGMNVLQTARYNTLYTYGASGLERTVETAAFALRDGGKAAAPLEVAGYLRLRGIDVPKTRDNFWTDLDALKAAAADPDFKVIIYGGPFNTLQQIKTVTGGESASALAAGDWERVTCGAYEILTRRSGKK